MAIHVLSNANYARMRRWKETAHDEYYGVYNDVMRAVHDDYFLKLQLSPLKVFLFILGRTLRYKKVAQTIFMAQFMEGVHNAEQEQTTQGTGLSMTTVRSSLDALAKMGVVDVYRCAQESKGAPTLYEINCKALLGFDIYDRKTGMPLHELQSLRAKKNAENRDKLGGKGGSKSHYLPLPKNSREENRFITTEEKAKALSAPRSARAERGLVVKKKTARETVEQLQSTAKQTRATRVATAAAKPAYEITKLEMQALVNQGMAMFHPDLPNVVITNATFGILRKRLKVSAPPDFKDFLFYVISTWETFVATYDKQARKRALRGVEPARESKPFHRYFNFSDLAYRYPYLLTIYLDHAGPRRRTEVDANVAEVMRLKKALAASQKEVAVTRKLFQEQVAASRKAVPAPRRAGTAVRTRPPTDQEVDKMFNEMRQIGPMQ